MTARVPERRKYLRMRQKLTVGWRYLHNRVCTLYQILYKGINEMKDFELGGKEREREKSVYVTVLSVAKIIYRRW
jgi:hypothetical protein